MADNTIFELLQPALDSVLEIDGVITTVAITAVLLVEIPLQFTASA